ncbi:uncharacterized protein K02A2.6-like [Achroia grisella]|uniref:uncharacterized protein K02A2.6-like n=1 Tax=Achroia grisella TaxID=688607 RepID=UPI0027D321BA|nr:uncharacterized protein K02A2.6-like [Achroia grisella]
MTSEKMSLRRDDSLFTAIQQPAPMQQDGNMATNWREWKMAFDCFLIASGKESASSKEKCALFMHVIGKYGREIFEELDISDIEFDYEKLCITFCEHCDPKKNVNYERHIFFETYQAEDNFDKFIGALKIKSKNCEFGLLKNSLILTQLIRGIKDAQMREKLLAKSSMSLDEAIQWCRAAERATEQAAACCSRQPNISVEQMTRQTRTTSAQRQWYNPGANVRTRGGDGRLATSGRRAFGLQPQWRSGDNGAAGRGRYTGSPVCTKCNLLHKVSDRCPAFSIRCYRCDKIGHFAKCCKIKFTHEVTEVTDTPEYKDNNELLLYNISIDTLCKQYESWYENVIVNGVNLYFKLDSGADASVMSLFSYNNAGFKECQLSKCATVLREISKNKLPVIGYFDAMIQYKQRSCKERIYVLEVNCNNLLSLRACVCLELILRSNELSVNGMYIDESVFQGMGCLPAVCRIVIDETVPPVVNATRKIPIKLRPRLKQELDNMVKQNIIIKEEGPTDWVSNIVVVEKPDKSLRVCLDPRNLNRAIKRSQFLLPTLDEIASNLSGAKYFSKCDAKKGFWMQKLDDCSSKLCTFSTPFGRYRFLRMPFGINSAPEIFHNEMYKIFKIEGVEVYIDDLLIWGKTREEHDSRLREVIRRAKENGVKFNKEKCLFGSKQVTFLGHIFSASGMQPDNNRVKAILDIPTPIDRKELERFLGVTNYLSRFIPNYSDIASPLRELLKKNILFEWLEVHEKSFRLLKDKISSAPVLRYYSPHEPVTVSVDASSRGLGACLLQGGQPVAYAARTLTPAESRWAQIEKEMLAVVFGCLRFHQYVYGHDKVTIESDHKPLEAILKKQLNETPVRLQRMLLKLQRYSVQLKYKPGRLLYIADTLSRAATDRSRDDDETYDEVMIHVNTLYENVEASSIMLNKIKEESIKDVVLNKVSDYYFTGWPSNKRDVTSLIKPFWNVHNEIHVVNSILFKGDRVIIPDSLRNEMLSRIHEGHLGVEKCQRRAREVIWWPGMSAAIERAVLNCQTCQRHRAANPREPLVPHPIPRLPWEIVAADIFEFKNKYYLLVVDYYSKFLEVTQIPNLFSSSVIHVMKDIFSRFGIPEKLVTDNGTQFTSQEFCNFSKSWEFNHVTSSPLYPRSNGLAERNVRTIKTLLLKSHENGEDWHLALLNFRNTPITGEVYSPAQLLMNRRLKTKLPTTDKLLESNPVSYNDNFKYRLNNIKKGKKYYDRGTRNLVPVYPHENVRMRQKNVWVKAKVKKQEHGNRSYWLETENGGRYRRNRTDILKLPNSKSDCVINRKENNYYSKYLDWDDSETVPSTSSSFRVTGHGNEAKTQEDNTQGVQAQVKTTSSGRVVRSPERFVCQ